MPLSLKIYNRGSLLLYESLSSWILQCSSQFEWRGSDQVYNQQYRISFALFNAMTWFCARTRNHSGRLGGVSRGRSNSGNHSTMAVARTAEAEAEVHNTQPTNDWDFCLLFFLPLPWTSRRASIWDFLSRTCLIWQDKSSGLIWRAESQKIAVWIWTALPCTTPRPALESSTNDLASDLWVLAQLCSCAYFSRVKRKRRTGAWLAFP